MNARPPRWPLKFLRWFCREDYLEEIEGDITEIFHRRHAGSPAAARRQFLWNVLRHFRPEFIKSLKFRPHYNTAAMVRNSLKTSSRNVFRNRNYAFINIAGLAIGIAVCMTIFIVIQFQTSFDTFHSKKDRIYRVLTEYHHADAANVFYGKGVPYPLPVGLKNAFPQLEQVAPVYASHNDQVDVLDRNGSPVKIFKENSGVFYTKPDFFDIFDFPLLAGSYSSLDVRNSVLLTKEVAEKYFGDWRSAIGKTIALKPGGSIWDHTTDILKVTGILATVPANTDFQFKLVVSFRTYFDGYFAKSTDWDGTAVDFGCFVLLPPAVSADRFNQQLRSWCRTVESPQNKDSHIIQPLSDIHYDMQAGDYSSKNISRRLINVLWLIAAFILLIACVNFINLSTAQAVNRAKEVGVRKVLGSNKAQLQVQFLVETLLIVTCALILAVGLSILALPSVNRLLELSLSLNFVKNPAIALFLATVLVFVTAVAGFYPSIVLSRFKPVTALKSKLSENPAKGISLRRGLVVFQFIVAQALIMGTLIIVRQMNYFMNQPLGFDKEAIINVPFRTDSVRLSKLSYLRKRLLSESGVQAVSFSSNTPVENGDDMWSTFRYNHS
ncbi:MAG TPA: ABC transporter permease, partial [Puia sp.]|nr:ABC transporter permease [Puia sp.]